MNTILVALIALGGAAVTGLVTYLIARRSSSGTIATSDAEDLWAAAKNYQDRMDAEFEKLRAHTAKLDTDFVEERRARIECERRLTELEAVSTAATIIEKARTEAKMIVEAATEARKVLAEEAEQAKDRLADEAS